MNKYQKFKHILEYFVAHLEWVTNKKTDARGYKTYICPLVEKNQFYATGQGYNGDSVQGSIKNWSGFDSETLYINIQLNYGSYNSVKCYINWAGTGLNVTAKWEGNLIKSLFLEEYHWRSKPAKRVNLKFTNTITELGLFDDTEPNGELIKFFDKYDSLLKEWYINEQKKINMEKIQSYLTLLEQSCNLILTGAPGTGKSFMAKQIAKQMIGVQTDEELEKSGQYTFVQFHPSYDYTDFVEGLRPAKNDLNGNIGFELKDGIFKEFCKKANDLRAINTGHITDFSLLTYEQYLNALELSPKTIANYKLRIEQLLGFKEMTSKKKITDKEKYASLEEICDNVENIKDFDSINKQHRQFASSVSNLINFRASLAAKKENKNELNPVFVFVIDEINRGEISKIFGELFFAIDPPYRGKKGAVKTQYSNLHDDQDEIFYVPDNVYIIGCMNDIDRSVESFDFAMRRRFAWREITAAQSAENMNLPEEMKSRMAKLNEQISATDGLNASYHIGGAYFLDKYGNPAVDYDLIWELRIEPLLQEYLRGIPDEAENLQLMKNAYTA